MVHHEAGHNTKKISELFFSACVVPLPVWGFSEFLHFWLHFYFIYHIHPCKIYRCREIRNTDDSPLFRYETFINFLTLVFRYEEKHNFYYADCTIWPNKRATHPVAPCWTGPTQRRISTNSFSKYPNSQPIAFGHDVIHTPVSFPIWGFYYDIYYDMWLSYPLRASMNCTQCVCTCTKSRIVQSPTKPNDKI